MKPVTPPSGIFQDKLVHITDITKINRVEKMHTVKEKVSNATAAAKEHVDIMKARAEEAAAKTSATTKEEKKIAKEIRKAKEAEAEMKLHQTHAENAAEKIRGRHSHLPFVHHDLVHGAQGHHVPVGTPVPTTRVPAPTYPLGGNHQKYH